MSSNALILIVEDSPVHAALAQAMLRDLGYRMVLAETAAAGLDAVRRDRPDVILLDLELPDGSGFGLMKQLREEGFDSAVIVVTANASIGTAVQAMREGATDFVVKPYAKARLTTTLSNVLEHRALTHELQRVKAQLGRDRFHGFIGASPPMQAVYRTIESVALRRANVFITGESGTGKELAAEAVHKASPRGSRPFIALNCAAIPRDLLESEVFGHVRGAFTGATDNRIGAAKAADGGTLFLDEIGEMPPEMQAKLLRFVQTGTFQPVGASRPEKVDVRFVCATNRDPLVEVEAGRFREDLYYRLYVVPIELPALRERGEDVLLIARHLLRLMAKEESRAFRGFAPATEAALLAYQWPGNIRQLQNVVRNIVVLHDGDRVEPAMLPSMLLRSGVQPAALTAPIPVTAGCTVTPPLPLEPPPLVVAASSPAADVNPLPEFPLAEHPLVVVDPPPPGVPTDVWLFDLADMKTIEKRAILAALLRSGQDVPRAATLLGINPATIYRRINTWRGEGTLPHAFAR
jgi:two-component system repressor protein LuxO